MKISYNWLKDYISINVLPEKLSEMLTNLGLEVEGMEEYEEIRGSLKGLVIGEVVTCMKHPGADKLSLTAVSIGKKELLTIVCGAPNVAAGQKVIVATEGTELSLGGKSFTISKTKIRGEVSEGMICAEDEIGMGTGHEGIMVLDPSAKPGMPANEYFNIAQDTVFEIGLTPNRIDAASHIGVARDLAAFLSLHEDITYTKPDISSFKTDDTSLKIEVIIEDSEGCRRFTGVTISGITVTDSPGWLQNRIKAIGLNPINNVVDITNYVLHELGQPLHAYDTDKLHERKIIVKRLPDGSKFKTLDEVDRSLSNQDVMICDGKGGVCIAGVLGGHDSGVCSTTKNIFLESAYFDPVLVRKTARRHGLSTDASFRFERGVDPQNTLFALKRAALMIKDIAGGVISSEAVDVHPRPVDSFMVEVSYNKMDLLIGNAIDRKIIRKILHSLEIEIVKENNDHLTLSVPPYRVDVTRECDIVEEILRIYGYNNIGFTDSLRSSITYSKGIDGEKMRFDAAHYLTDNGFYEIVTNPLTRSAYYRELTSYPENKLVKLLNPLSNDLNVMRQTMLFSGLEVLRTNIHQKNADLKIYEFGEVFSMKENNYKVLENYLESRTLALFITGRKEEPSWTNPETQTSFFQLKAFYLNMLKKIRVQTGKLSIRNLEGYTDIFAGGLQYALDKEPVIIAGTLLQSITDKFDIETPVYFAEILWDKLLTIAGIPAAFSELPKYPEVKRDLALLLNQNVEYADIEKLAFETEKKLLQRVHAFDVYKGKNIPEGKKSYAVSFYLRDLSKTLTDQEIDKAMNRIRDALVKNLNAELR